jgi:lipopolysaccharide export system protein LptC
MGFFKDAWDRFLLYVPLVFMVVLALGSYWLVRIAPPSSGPTPKRVESHAPDYFMTDFSVRSYDAAGRVRTEVLGEKARHYPDTQFLEIDAIRIRSLDVQGRLTTATALQGITNEDTSEVQLIGNAIVVREAQTDLSGKLTPRMEYRGEFLHAFMNSERIKSHKPVELIRGQDRFSADALDFDNVEQVLEMQGRVRGFLAAPQSP